MAEDIQTCHRFSITQKLKNKDFDVLYNGCMLSNTHTIYQLNSAVDNLSCAKQYDK